MLYHNSITSIIPLFNDTETRFSRLLMDNLSIELANQLADTVEYQCDTQPEINQYPSNSYSHHGGLYFHLLGDLDIASSETVPASIQDDLETAMDECYEAYHEEFDNADTNTEHYYEYEHNWLQGYRYYYCCELEKDMDGKLNLSVYINPDEYCRPNKNTYGNYHKTFHISDGLTEENMERIIDSVRNEILSQIWDW